MINLDEMNIGDLVIIKTPDGKIKAGLYNGPVGFRNIETGEMDPEERVYIWIEDRPGSALGNIEIFPSKQVTKFETKMKYGKEDITCTPIP